MATRHTISELIGFGGLSHNIPPKPLPGQDAATIGWTMILTMF